MCCFNATHHLLLLPPEPAQPPTHPQARKPAAGYSRGVPVVLDPAVGVVQGLPGWRQTRIIDLLDAAHFSVVELKRYAVLDVCMTAASSCRQEGAWDGPDVALCLLSFITYNGIVHAPAPASCTSCGSPCRVHPTALHITWCLSPSMHRLAACEKLSLFGSAGQPVGTFNCLCQACGKRVCPYKRDHAFERFEDSVRRLPPAVQAISSRKQRPSAAFTCTAGSAGRRGQANFPQCCCPSSSLSGMMIVMRMMPVGLVRTLCTARVLHSRPQARTQPHQPCNAINGSSNGAIQCDVRTISQPRALRFLPCAGEAGAVGADGREPAGRVGKHRMHCFLAEKSKRALRPQPWLLQA